MHAVAPSSIYARMHCYRYAAAPSCYYDAFPRCPRPPLQLYRYAVTPSSPHVVAPLCQRPFLQCPWRPCITRSPCPVLQSRCPAAFPFCLFAVTPPRRHAFFATSIHASTPQCRDGVMPLCPKRQALSGNPELRTATRTGREGRGGEGRAHNCGPAYIFTAVHFRSYPCSRPCRPDSVPRPRRNAPRPWRDDPKRDRRCL
jgi:hypothetical protein